MPLDWLQWGQGFWAQCLVRSAAVLRDPYRFCSPILWCCSHPLIAMPTQARHTHGKRVMSNAERSFAVAHLNLARQQAHAFAHRHGLAAEELLGPAYEGLCKAAMGFDAKRGWKPSSYVVPKVKGELLHYLRDTRYLPHISHRLRELWQRGRRYLPLALDDLEIAERCGVSLAEWLDCRRACGLPPISLSCCQPSNG